MIRACRDEAALAVYLDGPEAPPTPMCGRHGGVYLAEGKLRVTVYDVTVPPLERGFILQVVEG